MKHLRFLIVFAFVFSVCMVQAQWSAVARFPFFEGEMGKVFKSGAGGGIQYCGNVADADQFEFVTQLGFTVCHINTVADTLPTEAYANGVLIPGSFERYSRVGLGNLDMDGFVFLTRSEHWKPLPAAPSLFSILISTTRNIFPGW